MKVLFLDIDGVVCLHEKGVVNWGEDSADDKFDADCCRRLKQIIDATGCKLVLSSYWRLERADVQNMLRQLRPFGISRADFLGVTPLMKDRADEIMAFIDRYPNITSFVAVDDEDFFGNTFPTDRFVLTKLERGITESVKNVIIHKLLNG